MREVVSTIVSGRRRGRTGSRGRRGREKGRAGKEERGKGRKGQAKGGGGEPAGRCGRGEEVGSGGRNRCEGNTGFGGGDGWQEQGEDVRICMEGKKARRGCALRSNS